MARQLTSREYFFLAVFGIAGAIALYVGRDGGFGLGGTKAPGEEESLLTASAPVVHMERLGLPAEGYDAAARNLFDYYTPPPPPRTRPKPIVPASRPAPPTPKKQPVDRPPPSQTRRVEQPPRVPYVYLGYLGPKDDRIAVLELGEDMLLARAGEVVQERFRVVEFRYGSLLMGYTEEKFKDRTTELQKRK